MAVRQGARSRSEYQRMAAILIVYSTTDGHTRKICERLQRLIEADGQQVRLVAIRDVASVDLTGYDKIVEAIAAAAREVTP